MGGNSKVYGSGLFRLRERDFTDNLYVADASFFPSIGAFNPTLTIIASTLRVADRIKERLGA